MAEDQEQGDTRDEILAAFLLLLAATGKKVRALAKRYAQGDFSAAEFGDEMETALLAGHAEAAFLGRSLAGAAGAQDSADLAYADVIWGKQAEFLAGFVEDLEAGRYVAEGATVADALSAITARAEMYSAAIYGTANAAWVDTLPGSELITWHLGSERPCSTCPALAAGSPYLPHLLPTTPGAGGTECLTRCKCSLSSIGHGTAFTLPPDDTA